MESLNLNTLASSLPTSQQNAEKELMNDFRGTFSFFPLAQGNKGLMFSFVIFLGS